MERAGIKTDKGKIDKTKLKDDALEKTFVDIKDDEFEYELEEIIKELEDYINKKDTDENNDEDMDAMEFLNSIDFDCMCKK